MGQTESLSQAVVVSSFVQLFCDKVASIREVTGSIPVSLTAPKSVIKYIIGTIYSATLTS